MDGQFLAQVTVNSDVCIVTLEIQAFRFQVSFRILNNVLHVPDVRAVGQRVIGRFAISRAIGAAAHVLHLVAAQRYIALCDGNILICIIILDGQAAVVDGGISRRDTRQVRQLLCHLDFQFAIVGTLDSDVLIRQVALGSADDVELFVQFLRDDFGIIALELQAVIEGSHFMRGLVVVFVDDTRHAVLAVMTIRPVNSDSTVSALDGEAVGPILAIQADAAVPAVDDHGRAVFAVDADRTVNAILARRTRFAFFTDRDAVALDVLVHLDGQAAIGIPDDLEVFSGIIRIRFRAFPFNGQLPAQVTVNSDVCIVALEIQALCCHFLQLSHIDSVGIKRACSDTGNLTGDLAIVTYGNGVIRGFPGRTSRIPLNIDRLFFLIS